MNKKAEIIKADEEQILYGNLLGKGMRIGLICLLITFFLYASGIIPPAIPHDVLSKYWSLDVQRYMEAIDEDCLKLGHPVTGWAWVGLLGKGDYLNYVGIAILASVTIFCYLAIIPTLLRKGDKVYAVIAILEVLILSLAASGVLTAGH
jgi:hypothetical protein